MLKKNCHQVWGHKNQNWQALYFSIDEFWKKNSHKTKTECHRPPHGAGNKGSLRKGQAQFLLYTVVHKT